MKLHTLRAAMIAIEEGSLRAAARRLGMAQPSLSKAIRELERELGAELFERSGRGVRPTPAGRILLEHASSATRELDLAIERIGQSEGRMAGELRLTVLPVAVMVLLPEAVRTYSARYPDVQLRIHEELYMAQMSTLRKGEADLAIGPMPEGLPPGELDVEPLMPIRMLVVVRRESPLTGPVSLRDLAHERWVYTSASGGTGYARRMYEQHGLEPPRAGALVDSTLSLITLIASGDYVGLLPEPFARHAMVEPWMRVLDVREGPYTVTLASLTRKGRAVAPIVREFGAHLHRAASRLAAPARVQSPGSNSSATTRRSQRLPAS